MKKEYKEISVIPEKDFDHSCDALLVAVKVGSMPTNVSRGLSILEIGKNGKIVYSLRIPQGAKFWIPLKDLPSGAGDKIKQDKYLTVYETAGKKKKEAEVKE